MGYFQYGQRVTVTDDSRYRGFCNGHSGVVKALYSTSVAVLLDDIQSTASKHGYFYFHHDDLTPEKTAETAEKMEDTKMQKMTDFVNVAEVQFLDEKVPFRTFEYANYDPTLAVGDLCVVMSAHHGMGLAEVQEIKAAPTEDIFCREIVSKVDTANYTARVEKRKKAAELKERMQERAKQLQDLVLYATLAKEDPEMQALLEEFTTLNNSGTPATKE